MRSRPLHMLAWIMTLSAPVYAWGYLYPIRDLPFGLPGTAVMIVLPAIVATAMTYRERGSTAARQLWLRTFDVARIESTGWAAVALLAMPVATLVAYLTMQALDLPLPDAPSFDIAVLPVAFALYFAGAIPEEIGWTGYATEPLQERFGVLGAGLIIGAGWAAWHLIPWALIQGHATMWVIGQSALTVLMRIAMGFIYANGGKSLFLAALFHATINTSYSLFPNNGSHYDPLVLSAVLGLGMTAAALGRARYR